MYTMAPKRASKHRLRQPDNCRSPPSAEKGILVAQSWNKHEWPSSLIPSGRRHAPRTSAMESTPATNAEYQEWPLQGCLKHTRIGNEILYNLEFSLKHLPELLELSIPPQGLNAGSDRETSARPARFSSAASRAKTPRPALRPQSKRPPFTPAEDARLVNMKESQGLSWKQIVCAFPGRSVGTLQVHYSTKLKTRASTSRKRRRSTGCPVR
jgi:hypothetical protein